jgi:hypothetical protein
MEQYASPICLKVAGMGLYGRAIGDTTEGVHGETLSLAVNQVKSGKGAVGTDGTTYRSAAG